MVTTRSLLLFVTASIPLLLFPGPAVAFILATTLRAGRRSGLGAVAGVETGYLVHVLGAVVGLSAVVAASAEAFTAVKVLGAAWLVWLAVQSWRSARRAGDTSLADLRPAETPQNRARESFTRGLLVGALNPKTAVFYLAFLPQFVSHDGGPAWLQLLVFGLLFIVLAACSDSCWVLAGGSLRRWLPAVRMKVVDRISAGAFGALAAVLLSARRASAGA
jgi:threonine/homoserine/homoserine lactone efflux protein